MKWLIPCMLLVCSGCSVTLNATGRWVEPQSAAPDAPALQAQYDQYRTRVFEMAQELTATTNEIGAVNAVLKKYGIQRP